MSYKVVIIDDEPWTRGVILKLGRWDELDMEVVGEAADGETGLELIQRVLPDVVITDVRMPRLSGLELTQRLREEGWRTPILIVSGYDDYSYVRSALKLGVTDYILKPIKPEELNQQLQHCIELIQKQPLQGSEAAKDETMEASFFADGWEAAYGELRQKLEAALYAGNRSAVAQQLAHLGQTIRLQEGETPSATTMIGVYYALLYQLQKYMDTVGMKREEVFRGSKPVYVFSRDNTIDDLIDFIHKLFCETLDHAASLQQMRRRLDIEAVCRYLQENYLQGITLEQTADVFHVSKEYLSRAFKATKQEGFAEYVTRLRMKRAYALIVEYGVPLKEVGAMVGYYDQAHFYKTFKKFYGTTPGELKNSLKIDNETTPI